MSRRVKYASDEVNASSVHLPCAFLPSNYIIMPPMRASDKRITNNTESDLEIAKSQWEQGLFRSRQDATEAHSVS